jgi:glutamyl/glutaminyl-tRNA synthetase
MAKNPAAVALGRRGGKAYVKNTTPEQRRESAKKAIAARWAKARKLTAELVEGAKRLEEKAVARAKQKKEKA